MLKQLKAGAKFEDLAKKYSEDPGSAKEGGSLGWIGKGRTVPEFEKAAFSLPKGEISDLVKSSYGFHIIRVDDKQDAHMKTLDEVKAEIEPVLKQQKTQEAAQKQADELLQMAKTQRVGCRGGCERRVGGHIRFLQPAKTWCRDWDQRRSSWMQCLQRAEKSPPGMAATSRDSPCSSCWR